MSGYTTLRSRLVILTGLFLCIAFPAIAQVSIPGVTNDGLNTDKTIEKLMELERKPLDRMQQSIKDYKQQKQVWNELDQSLTKLRDSARKLFGFDNPFNDRVANSSQEAALTATATRDAPEQTTSITVKSLAGADKFLSKSLPADTQVPAGRYGFRVGETERAFNFSGGSLAEFAQAVNKYVGELVRARVVNNTPDTRIITFESQKTGAENPLSFTEDAQTFARQSGVIERTIQTSRTPEIAPGAVAAWTKPLDPSTYSISDGALTVQPGGEVSLPIQPALTLNNNMVLELEARVVEQNKEAWQPPSPPPGPALPDPGSVTLDGVTVPNAPSQAVLPPWKAPEPPKVVTDSTYLYAQSGSRTVALPDIAPGDGLVTLKIPLADYVSSIDALGIRNANTYRTITVRNVRIYDPQARGDFRPLHAIETASDAHISVDGVDVTRSSNDIEDVVAGTTLHLHGISRTPVELQIEPDREQVKNSIIQFVGNYNQIIRDVNILTRSNESIVNEISYFSDDEKKKAMDRLGLFQGDTGLNQMKSRFQTVMMNSYPTSAGRDVNLLAQIGISTNASGFNTGGYNASRLRGYLEINEQELDSALQNKFKAVKDLFGYDTNNDLAVDSGVAFEVDRYVRPYVQVGGIIASRSQSLDTQIASTQRDIDDYNRYLDNYEQKLRNDFATAQGALNDLKDRQRSIQNLNPQGNGN